MGTVKIWSADMLTLFDGIVAGSGSGWLTHTYVTGYSRPGTTYAARVQNVYLNWTVPVRTDYYIRWVSYIENVISDGGVYLNIVDNNGTVHLWLGCKPNAGVWELRLNNNSGALRASCAMLTANTVACYEIYCSIDDVTGRYVFKVNGETLIDFTGDTRNGAEGNIGSIRCNAESGGTGRQYISEFVVRDDAWPGQGMVKVLVPTGGGTHNAWTGTYADVDELPPSMVDNVYQAYDTPAKISFTHDGISTAKVINSVTVASYSQVDAAGDAAAQLLLRYNGTDYNDASRNLSISPRWSFWTMNVGPDALELTQSKINAAEFGIEVPS